MATPAVTYTFASNTLVKASEANTNFQDLVDFLTSEVIQKDGSVAFSAHASGPAVDPATDNQYARKAYVDNRYRKVFVGADPNPRNGITGSMYKIPGTSYTHTYVAGRTYRFSMKAGVDMSGNGYVFAVVTSAGAEVLRVAQDNSYAATGRLVTGFATSDDLSGSIEYHLGCYSPFGTMNITGNITPTEFLVEDLG